MCRSLADLSGNVSRRLRIAAVLVLGVGTGAACNVEQTQPEYQTRRETAGIRQLFAGNTMITYNPQHGTQVEYHRADYRSFLWYPGNTRPVPADWKTYPGDRENPEICWKYPVSSVNPVTRQRGNWQCTDLGRYAYRLVQIIEGDPFSLASGAVPFQLQTGRYTAEDLMARAGRRASDLTILYPFPE
ncbi:hypothetical protein [Palleronia caenipelagi]|uniref:Uncharacterized protein n=1 Tax=Palleronia caenipelagi TaxID=2489174 RepID=A0A547PXR7_9RHOB|nr:hypothetical protein [Palleronia caenipelagi]TRD18904.1 hypothetical protein FEV53_11780 [Palleronia caenipelagi]